METTQAKVHGAICSVMAEIGGVAKSRKNQGQGYQYRGIADLYLATQPLMAKHRLHIIPYRIIDESWSERETKNGGKMILVRMRVQYRVHHEDGSFVEMETTGEAMDTGDKATNKAMSSAMKYALIQLFAIPEEDPEIDTEKTSPAIDETVPKEKGITPNQLKAIQAIAGEMKIGDGLPSDEKRSARIGWLNGQITRKVSSTSDLTESEASKIIDAAKVVK